MRKLVIFILATVSLFGQDAALARLKQHLADTRAHASDEKFDFAGRVAASHASLRDWLETQIPKEGNPPTIRSSALESILNRALEDVESSPPLEDFEDPGFNHAEVSFDWRPELPDILIVYAYIQVHCGLDEAVYLYRFDATGRHRVLEDHPKAEYGMGAAPLEISAADERGQRLLLIHRSSAQCASMWMQMSYSLYRVDSLEQRPQPVLEGNHGFYLGYDDGLQFALKPQELIIELVHESLDTSILIRTHVLRYNVANGVRRIEPFALRPQDFAEEWLTAAWGEMRSTSAPATQQWHEQLHANLGHPAYTNVVPCANRPDRWMIGFEDPIDRYFLVHDLGQYRYQMEEVSDKPFEGCPGHGDPSHMHQWLSLDELKSLQ